MTKNEFESAVAAAVDAGPKNGAKWAPVTKLFEPMGVLAGGALNNQQPEQRTRIQQILAPRKVQGQTRFFQFAAFVLNQDEATRHKASPAKVLSSVIEKFKTARPQTASNDALQCAVILRHDGGHVFVPLAVLSWAPGPLTTLMRQWYPLAAFEDLSSTAIPPVTTNPSPSAGLTTANGSDVAFKPGDNIIFFGPPGTGKSYRIKEETAEFFDVLMTAFHPEFSYSDFVGAYKPVCGAEPGKLIKDFTGQADIDYPVIYYTFEPGILIRAIVRAHEADGAPVALVIDELNRGDCAAIFGDFMHLLDRTESGGSEYGLDISLPLGAYLVHAGVLESATEKLFLPENLHILATINTSDQALYPIDSAFKRRWNWEAMSVTAEAELADVVIPVVGDSPELRWLDFVSQLNAIILERTENEDKRIGPWFIKAAEKVIPPAQVRNKLLYFLWHDVFRGHAGEVFDPTLRTFEAVQQAFDNHGIPGVLSAFTAPAAGGAEAITLLEGDGALDGPPTTGAPQP